MRKRYLWLVGATVIALVAALAVVSCGGDSTSTTAAPAGPTTTSGAATTAGGTVDAAAIYAQDCGGCHKKLPGGSLDEITSAIEKGKGDEMPGFADKLSAEEITALAQWLANGGK